MITIKNLVNVSLAELTMVFNDAFADYIMKITVTESYLENRWTAAGVDYSLSFGAFEDEQLVGFIIHAIGEWNGNLTAFNVGTGVIPEFRGQRLVKKIYDHAVSLLIKNDIKECRLEVIQGNEKAIKAYQSVGFIIERDLICYNLKLDSKEKKSVYNNRIFREESLINVSWEELENYWDFLPSWENSNACLKRNKGFEYVQLLEDNKTKAYAIVNPVRGTIAQFGVLKGERKKGYGLELFNYLMFMLNQLVIINIESNSLDTIKFLEKMGLKELISQHEMQMDLSRI